MSTKELLFKLPAIEREAEKLNDLKDEVFYDVLRFFEDNGVTCEETIYQSDTILESAQSLLSDLFEYYKKAGLLKGVDHGSQN